MKKKIAVVLALTIILANGPTAQAKTIDVPQEVVDISEELGNQYGICPELIQAICFKESGFQPDAENGGCVGIMQISPEWHKERMNRLGVLELKDAKGNMTVGVDYLADLVNKYEDIGIVLMVYNGDSGADDVMNGNADISDYAVSILEISAELERENGK